MSDKDNDDARARVRTLMEETREAVQPHVNAMVEGMRQVQRGAATLAGDPITPENQDFWNIAGNLFVSLREGDDKMPNAAGPEIANLVALSKAIAASSRYQDWAGAGGICERFFDELDGGEELGLSEGFLDCDWADEAQREVTLRKGMQFHRVPRSYQTAVADVVADLMLAAPHAWNYVDKDGTTSQLPQPWATTCSYVIGAIVARVKANDDGSIWDGQHRRVDLH